jgi:hypothetical protein
MYKWGTFSARTNHGQTRVHKTHHGPDLGEAITFLLIVFFTNGPTPKCHFVSRLPSESSKIPKIRTLETLKGHNFV